jgi:hypothetical protein
VEPDRDDFNWHLAHREGVRRDRLRRHSATGSFAVIVLLGAAFGVSAPAPHLKPDAPPYVERIFQLAADDGAGQTAPGRPLEAAPGSVVRVDFYGPPGSAHAAEPRGSVEARLSIPLLGIDRLIYPESPWEDSRCSPTWSLRDLTFSCTGTFGWTSGRVFWDGDALLLRVSSSSSIRDWPVVSGEERIVLPPDARVEFHGARAFTPLPDR